MGMRPSAAGRVEIDGQRRHATPRPAQIIELGVGHVPEDRSKHGLVGAVLDRRQPRAQPLPPRAVRPARPAQRRRHRRAGRASSCEQFDVRTPEHRTCRSPTLSGGNQQKVIIARELTGDVKLLVVAQPTRGLDVGSIEFIHRRIVEMRDQGAAVLLVSAELDEILNLSDRIGVLYRGALVGEFDRGRRHPRRARPAHGLRPRDAEAAADGRMTAPGDAATGRAAPACASRRRCQPVLVPVCAIVLALAVGGRRHPARRRATRSRPTGRCSAACSAAATASPPRSAGRRRSSAPRSRSPSRSAPGCSTSASRASCSSAPPLAAWVGTFSWLAGRARPILRSRSCCSPAPSAAALWGGIPGVLKATHRRPRGDHHDHAQQHRGALRALAGELAGPGRSSATPTASVPAHRADPRRRPGCPSSSTAEPPLHLGLPPHARRSCVLVWFVLQRTTLRLRDPHGRRQPQRRHATPASASTARSSLVMALSGALRRARRRRRDRRHRRASSARACSSASASTPSRSRCSPGPTRSRIIPTVDPVGLDALGRRRSCSRRPGCRSTSCASCRRSCCSSSPPT